MSGGITPLQANYAITTKVTAGRTFKESLIKKWTLSMHNRNVYILLTYRAVEMSFCTRNSRRIRLVDLLSTVGISKLIDAVDPIKDPVCKAAVKEALKSTPERIVKLYFDNPDWRDDISNLVTCCLEAFLTPEPRRRWTSPCRYFGYMAMRNTF